jgi:4-amino-4-deoxy-L-arabinose transferase-like glycosyltransferase
LNIAAVSRTRSLLLIATVWAIGYLPALGSLQIRGEEGRRVLPAIAMLESSAAAANLHEAMRAFVVPQVVGRPYLRKPPLVNWLIATSFKLSGYRNAWTARLPSTLFVLAVAIAFLTVTRPHLGAGGSTIAALCWLTSLGTLEKGRMIEIDAINTSLFAVAFICWVSWWLHERPARITWIVPLLLLGFSLLAKGPVAVSFFYALVVPLLWQRGRLKELIASPHALGVGLMLGIFALWVIPVLVVLGTDAPFQTWSQEMFLPVAGREVLDVRHWLLNLPRGALLFLPAAFLLPFIRYGEIQDARLRDCARTISRVALALYIIVLLLPGSYPKYAMPLIPVMCWVIGVAFNHNAFVWRLPATKAGVNVPRKLVLGAVAACALVAVVAVPLHAATYPQSRQHVKRNGERLNAVIAAGEPLYLIDPQHESFFFYLRGPLRYVRTIDDLPASARYILVRARDRTMVETSARWGSPPRMLAQTDAAERDMMVVYAIQDPR